MPILQSDWLSDRALSAVSVQWLEVVYKMATSFRLFKFLRKVVRQMENQIAEKT